MNLRKFLKKNSVFNAFPIVFFSPFIFLFLLILSMYSISYGISKITVDVAVEVKNIDDVVLQRLFESVSYAKAVSLNDFEITLKDAFKDLSSELRLQDILSSLNVILSNQKEASGILKFVISFEKFEKKEIYNEYIRNNLSGDYVRTIQDYVKVNVNQRYKLEFIQGSIKYVPSPDGTFVKGYDGNYYSVEYSDFYTKFPHTDVSFLVKAKVDYYFYAIENGNNVLKLQGSFDINKDFKIVVHNYDPYNNRLLRHENNIYSLTKDLAFEIEKKLVIEIENNKENKTIEIVGTVEDVNFPRVLINLGDDDGVKKGMIFGVKNKEEFVADLRVERVARDYSECEVIFIPRNKGIVTGMTVFPKSPEKAPILGLIVKYETGLDFSLNSSSVSFGLLLKEFNLHHEVISQFEGALSLSFFSGSSTNAIFWLSTSHKVFGEGNYGIFSSFGLGFGEEILVKAGIQTRLNNFFLEIAIVFNRFDSFSLDTLRIGGGVLW